MPARSAGDYNTADFLPGLNGVPWGGMVNGNFIVLSGMSVLRSHSSAVSDIAIEVYPHWDAVRDKAAAEPSSRLPAAVTTYEAQNGFVFRAVVRPSGSAIACIDLVIPYNGSHAVIGRLHYYRGGIEYVAGFTPARLRQ